MSRVVAQMEVSIALIVTCFLCCYHTESCMTWFEDTTKKVLLQSSIFNLFFFDPRNPQASPTGARLTVWELQLLRKAPLGHTSPGLLLRFFCGSYEGPVIVVQSTTRFQRDRASSFPITQDQQIL